MHVSILKNPIPESNLQSLRDKVLQQKGINPNSRSTYNRSTKIGVHVLKKYCFRKNKTKMLTLETVFIELVNFFFYLIQHTTHKTSE